MKELIKELTEAFGPSGSEDAVRGLIRKRISGQVDEMRVDALGSLIALKKGTSRSGVQARKIMLAAHMDTVMPGRGVKPVVKDGIVYSDGTTVLGADDKSGIAVILELLQTIVERELPHPPLEVVITVREETGLVGAKGLDKDRLQAKMGISFDCGHSPGTIVVSAPSHNFVSAVIHGKAAHAGSEPEQGINAIAVAAQALVGMPLGRMMQKPRPILASSQGAQPGTLYRITWN